MSRIKDASLKYCAKSDLLASLSYFGTYAVFFSTLIGATLVWGNWLAMAPLVVICAFAGVRLYVLQHDTGHFSLFSTRQGNIWAGYGLSIVTLTPFRAMQYNHNLHHANVGNLDNRETGEVHTMTLEEWETAPWQSRLWYRMYRNPFTSELPMSAWCALATAVKRCAPSTKTGTRIEWSAACVLPS